VAPLRAVGWEGSVDAVDLDPSGERLFRELCGDWCGSVRFRCAEAAAWLRRSRRRYEAILDDLSIARRGAITKPGTSFEELPALIRRRLAGGGVAAVNSLPVSGMSWRRQRARLVGPHRQARVVLFREFENRVVLGGDSLPPVRSLSRRLRGVLREIDSRIAESISVRDPADGQEGSDPGIAPFRRPT
jgi:hypothetical protein